MRRGWKKKKFISSKFFNKTEVFQTIIVLVFIKLRSFLKTMKLLKILESIKKTMLLKMLNLCFYLIL